MQRLRAPEHRGERLDGGPHHVVHRLLRGVGDPGGLRVEPQAHRGGIGGAVSITQPPRPDAPSRPELRDLFEEVDVAVEEERQPRGEAIHVEPAAFPEFDVAEPVGQRERQLLGRRRSGLADVVAAHAHRMELGAPLGTEGHEVADQPQVRTRREDPFLLRDVLLEDVGLQRAVELIPRHPLAFRRGQEERERHGGRPADRHRRADVAQGDRVEQRLEIVEGIGRHAASPHLALAARVVGVQPHQGGHVEGDAEPALTLRQQEAVPRVGLGGRAEPGELPHGPQAAPVHRGVDPAREGELPWQAQSFVGIPGGQVLGGGDLGDGFARQRSMRTLGGNGVVGALGALAGVGHVARVPAM